MSDDLFTQLEPLLADAGMELVDVERRSSVLLVTVDRTGGVDLDTLTEANRAISRRLDELDPIPGHYTLEVSSPGVERTLRRPAHFVRAIGETVTVKTRPQVPGDRRRRGTLTAADEEGFTLAVEGGPDEGVRLVYTEIDKARTVFEWGAERGAKRPGKGRGQVSGGATGQATELERKQVATP